MSATARHADHPINPVFVERWSPRAFTGEAVPVADLLTMVEAARWSPSSYNSQPWRFVYALAGTPAWQTLLGLLGDYNTSWASRAGALVCLASSRTMLPPGKTEPVPSHSHSLDAGAAWGAFALQAHMLGWATHGMVGFDMERAATELGIPDGFRVEMMIAVGRQGDPSALPEALRGREAPSPRLPVSAIAAEGRFPDGP